MQPCVKVTRALRSNLLLLLTLVGVVVGVALGFIVRAHDPSDNVLMWLGLPGQLYLRLLKMAIVPLLVSSVITGTAALDPKSNGKISLTAFLFIAFINMVGTVLGIAAFYIFKPGNVSGRNVNIEQNVNKPIQTEDIFADLIRNVIPDNVFEATFRQTQTKYIYNDTRPAANVTLTIIEKYVDKTDGPNLLGLIFACTLIGMAASGLKSKAKALIDFFEASTHTVIAVIRWLLWTTPIGVLSLILVSVADISDVSTIFRDLALFIAAVTSGLVFQQLIVMPLILFALTRRNPYKHMLHISRPWLIAFAAAGTAVAIPEMLHACEVPLRIDKRVARFVIPFSVTLCANGSAVFIACSCLFISTFTGSAPTSAVVLLIGLLSSVSALAIPSVPSASIVTIVMIMTSLNIPTDAIALLLTVEFFLDRLRTTSSVAGHTMAAAVTHHFCRRELENKTQDEAVEDIDIDIIVEHERLVKTLETSQSTV